jgi:hypothetical protein
MVSQPNFNKSRVPVVTLLSSSQPTNMDAILDKVPKLLLNSFAAIGFVFLGSKVLSYIQLLLSLFVLSGKNVCGPSTPTISHTTC